jgi:hypothetical protein
VKIYRLELGDVLHLVGVGKVLDHVFVQLPAVRVNEGNGEASGAGGKPGPGSTQELNTPLPVRLNRGVQQVRRDIAGKHQEHDEEPAMYVCPDQRERKQPQQHSRISIGAGGALRYMQCGHEEQQSKKMGPCQPMNGAGPRCQ